MLRNFYIFGLKWLTHYLNYNNMCSGKNDTRQPIPLVIEMGTQPGYGKLYRAIIGMG